jgi:hypothetical protein
MFTQDLTANPPESELANWDSTEPIIVFGTICYEDRYGSPCATEFAARYHRVEMIPGEYSP